MFFVFVFCLLPWFFYDQDTELGNWKPQPIVGNDWDAAEDRDDDCDDDINGYLS